MPTKIPLPNREDLVRDRQSMTRNEISQKYGISLTVLTEWLRKLDIPFKKDTNTEKFKMPDKDVFSKQRETMTTQALASYYEVSISTINKWIKLFHVELKQEGAIERKEMPSREKFVEDCKVMTVKELSIKYNCSVRLISDWKKSYNISANKRGVIPSREELAIDTANMNVNEIAGKYGVQVRAVNKWRQKYGI